MVRHSHHHVPAHIGGVRYVPPCCGCGGINRQTQAREIAAKKAQQKAGFEHLQNLQQAAKQEPIPKHVREMAGIKLKQQLAKDTVSLSQVLQQKGISKEKALEKLLDKLVGMYASEKELMKALKNLEINKLLELLKKALSTVNETSMEKEDSDKKKVEKVNNKNKVIKVTEKEQTEDDNDNEDDPDKPEKILNDDKEDNTDSLTASIEEDSFETNTSKVLTKKRKSKNKLKKDTKNRVNNKTNSEIPDKLAPVQSYKIDISKNQVKFSGNTYSIEAKNLLKEQNDIEIAQIRRELIYEKHSQPADNPIKKDSVNSNTTENKELSSTDNKRLEDLEKENEKLKKIILELEKERRAELISKDFLD